MNTIQETLTVQESQNYNLHVDCNDFCLGVGTSIIVNKNVGDIYDGETVVIPAAFRQQVLNTQNKLVLDDITVMEIPYTEVSNLSGGTTVSIG